MKSRGNKLLGYRAKRLMSAFADKEPTVTVLLLFVREGGH